jgi:hypothetical protein
MMQESVGVDQSVVITSLSAPLQDALAHHTAVYQGAVGTGRFSAKHRRRRVRRRN